MRVTIMAKPGSRRPGVTRLPPEGDIHRLLVRVAARAQGGAANDAVRRAVAEALGVPPTQVTLLRGPRSRSKHLHIAGDESRLATALAAIPAEGGR